MAFDAKLICIENGVPQRPLQRRLRDMNVANAGKARKKKGACLHKHP
jgi:hypothetical protein